MKYDVNAGLEIVSTIKGKPLTEVERITDVYDIRNPALDNCPVDVEDTIAAALVNTLLREQYAQTFRQRLRSDTKLKHQIGGTRWSVNVRYLQVNKAI